MWSQFSLQALAAYVLFIVGRWIYRLTLHPLAKVPGPKLAAMTSAYAMSWDFSPKTSYVKNFIKWHEMYGPIIRIEPNHVHILDIESYNKVFKIGTKFYRDPAIYGFPFTKGGFFNKLHVKDAKPHRDLYMGYFSRTNVQSLESSIQEHLSDFLTHIDKLVSQNSPIDMTRAFRCVIADTVMRYAYDKSFGSTLRNDFKDPMLEAIGDFFNNSALGWYLPNFMNRVVTLAKAAPRNWTTFDAGLSAALHNLDGCLERIVELKKDPPNHQTPSIFQTALHPNPEKGHPVLTDNDLAADALTIFTAGTDTTAHTLTTATWHLLRNPSTLQKLQTELGAAIPPSDSLSAMPLDWSQLESLPYLRAVVKESLRIASAVPGKLPRMVPPGGAELAGQFLPAGTAISMTMHSYHQNSAFFREPEKFKPERWLDGGGQKGEEAELDKYWMPFSRGSRNCIGQNLAWAELYYCLGYLFRRFEMRVAEDVGEGDMEWKDCFVVVTRGHLRVRARRAEK